MTEEYSGIEFQLKKINENLELLDDTLQLLLAKGRVSYAERVSDLAQGLIDFLDKFTPEGEQ